MKQVLIPLAVLWLVVIPARPSADERPILAVFPLDTKGIKLQRQVKDNLAILLEVEIAKGGVFRKVPSNSLKEALRQKKKDTYRECYDSSCKIELGRELAASKSLSTTVIRIDKICTVMAELYDLKTQTTDVTESQDGECSPVGLKGSIRKVAAKLRGWGGEPVAAPAPVAAPMPAPAPAPQPEPVAAKSEEKDEEKDSGLGDKASGLANQVKGGVGDIFGFASKKIKKVREQEDTELGLTLTPLNEDRATEYKLSKNLRGLLVVSVHEEGPSDGRLKEKDVILRVGKTKVTTVAEFEDAVYESPDTVMLRVQRKKSRLNISIKK